MTLREERPVSLPTTAVELRPECRVGEHSWCKPGEVRVDGVLVFPAKRCDCSCHRKGGSR